MRKKYSKEKVLWAVLAVIAVCSFIINIVLSCVYSNSNANIFTAISGWVSGVATFFVGIIAYKQSKQYTYENKRREYLDRVEMERRDLVLEFFEVVRYNQYSDALIVLCNSFRVNTKLTQHYDYNFKVSELRDKLISYRNVIQTYSFIPNSIISLYNKTTDMIKLVLNNFDLQPVYADKMTFEIDIQIATKKFIAWGEEMHNLKKACINEMNIIIEEINRAKNISDLNKIYNRLIVESLDKRHKIEANDGI